VADDALFLTIVDSTIGVEIGLGDCAISGLEAATGPTRDVVAK
jgi:hypothetical protein